MNRQEIIDEIERLKRERRLISSNKEFDFITRQIDELEERLNGSNLAKSSEGSG